MGNIEQLIQEVLKGRSSAERELYKFIYIRLFKVARSYCSDYDEATGVFNFSMVDIFKHLKPFKDEDSLLKWSRRIIVNDCIDHIRKKTVYKNKLLVVADDIPKVTSNEGLSNLSMDEIFALIDKLDVNCRACFAMFVLDGFSHKEIAQKLNINVNTSKWYVSKAKKELRVLLSKTHIC